MEHGSSNIARARKTINDWRQGYHVSGLHSPLNYQTPTEFVTDWQNITDEEISVMHDYSRNPKTRQIVNYIGCNVKTVYLHKYAAMRKLNTQCNSRFYSSLRHIIC
ncbi:TPA: hypothetical protein ONC18_004151 [Enterobacter kobei]|nr:hypothetical protein [Enterobacter asburiae]HCR1911394.1 hypothetical protein [Enterobacter kobei]